jgi:hypothetical protein
MVTKQVLANIQAQAPLRPWSEGQEGQILG